ncbi:hypothetical protein HMPREF1983_00620 [Gemella bergeri ATCC 700627]|uniref:Lantibiotic ABC transporter n=1 Tax=Gemella bergeri ATCC 700627 TaxID=1321820 RepID=U2S873_9BACL|nr:BtrH N-terminal domain-containing protein [Gemella bergeri]ERK58982.1 hypothetical protein HMPREF1983_00620 [Gemella bergeri ATCC 700627]
MKITTKSFIGQHCESTATGTLLNQLGIELSEPLLFGLGEGLGFIIWNMKNMDFPFIGGRIKTDLLTKNIAQNLNLKLIVKETTSKIKAWKEVKQLLDSGKAVGLKLDCYYLEYFKNPPHFAGHYVAILGYDDKNAYLVDTVQQGSDVKTSLESLAMARSEKGPMSSKNLYYILEKNNDIIPLKEAIVTAIRNNAHTYLNPPIKNLNYKGIEKASEEIIKWFDRSANRKFEFSTSAMLMERSGTGGALFRNIYRDFLHEAYQITNNQVIKHAYNEFIDIAKKWAEVISLFEKVGETDERTHVLQAADVLKIISKKEKETMELLKGI